MQLTVKIKGSFKIAILLLFSIITSGYGLYKLYKYIYYRSAIYGNEQKQKDNLDLKITVLANDPSQKGYLLFTTITSYRRKNYSSLVITDLFGKILMQRKLNGIAYDFRQWRNDGNTCYSYAINEQPTDSTAAFKGSSGHIVILDSTLKEVKQVHLKSFDGVTATNDQDLDLHDFIMVSRDHFITMASVLKSADNIPVCLSPAPGCRIIAPVIQETRNDSVIWQWDASKYQEFYLSSTAGNKFYDTTHPQDYIHMNSMVIDPKDSNLIVSFLNQNQVLKIDRHTGNILWRLGGCNSDFSLVVGQAFIKQHHATLVDAKGTLVLLDNGDKDIRPYSRVIEFRLNEKNRAIDSFKSFNIPMQMAGSRGSVQKVGSNYLICGGISNYLLIIDPGSGIKKMELKANQNFYRVYVTKSIPGIR